MKRLLETMNLAFQKGRGAINALTLFCTFVALYCWLFLVIQAFVGEKSAWWLLFGPIMVGPVLVLLQMAFELREELLKIGWVQLLIGLLGTARDVLALIAIHRATRLVNDVLAERPDAGALDRIGELLWKIILG